MCVNFKCNFFYMIFNKYLSVLINLYNSYDIKTENCFFIVFILPLRSCSLKSN